MTAEQVREMFKDDVMFQMLELVLPLSLEATRNKEKNPTKYLLDELRKRGFEVAKK